jgi:hypothetical protein
MAAAREEDEATQARPLLLPRRPAQEDQKWWRRWAREAGWVGYLALPMVVVNLSQYAVQVSSNMMVGHLPGVLPLSSAAIATSLANVSGFSLLVRTLPPFPCFRSRPHILGSFILPLISHAVPCFERFLGWSGESHLKFSIAVLRLHTVHFSVPGGRRPPSGLPLPNPWQNHQ